mmetsp:Transcript_23334/g.59576  ORF Transcript_23334/g.59576 Transcript_23334/m.59576 type:complete len:155 (-) Transcript_23334:37-501(-)
MLPSRSIRRPSARTPWRRAMIALLVLVVCVFLGSLHFCSSSSFSCSCSTSRAPCRAESCRRHLSRGQRQPAAMMATARTAMASDGDRGGGPAREESSASERLQQEAAREALRDAPVGQMAGAIGEQGVGTLFSVLAVLFVVMSALTAAVLNGTS